jgi:hypothetical protein
MVDVQEAVDGMMMGGGFSTGTAGSELDAASSRQSADNFSAAEPRAKSGVWPSHKQIHNSYCYC